MMSELNIGGDGIKRGENGSDDLKGPEHAPTATVLPGKPVDVRAGAGVSATEQVNILEFCQSPPDVSLDAQFSSIDITERNEKEISRNLSRAASSILKNGKNAQEASSHTDLENILNDSENGFFDSVNKSNDDFSPNKIEYFETSLNPADLTIVNPTGNISNYESFKEKNYSGAERRNYKKQKREEARREMVANETPEESTRRKHCENEYNVRNKSYAQAAKAAGGRMLEIRSQNQDYLLEQEDYNTIDTKCGMEFLRLWRTGDKTEYYIKGGLSQGGVWMSCKNDETLRLAKEFIATLSSPSEDGGKYKVYGEDEKPYLYIQAWIPARWWELRTELFDLICFSNRWLVDPLEDGQLPHFRLSSGLTKKKSNDRGFFECTFEVDENLFPLIAKKKGQFDIVMSTTKFFGSGIVAAAKRLIMEEYDRMMDGMIDQQ